MSGQYQYYITDHLGNTRVVVSDSGKTIQRTDYYPFGLPIPLTPSTSDSTRLANKYLFIDRELQPETGYFDLKWRQYDPAKARFDGVDSKPDEGDQESLSTYQYGWNNPILRSDPNGDCPCDDPQNSIWLASTILGTAKELAVSGVNTLALITGNPLRVKGGNALMDFELDASRLAPQTPMQMLTNVGSDVLDAANVAATMYTGGASGAGVFFAKTGGKAIVTTAAAKAGKEVIEETKFISVINSQKISGIIQLYHLRRRIEKESQYGEFCSDQATKTLT